MASRVFAFALHFAMVRVGVRAVLLLITVCWPVSEAQIVIDGGGLPPAQRSCCFGRQHFTHGQTVLTLDSCCVSFVCNYGDIEIVRRRTIDGRCHDEGSGMDWLLGEYWFTRKHVTQPGEGVTELPSGCVFNGTVYNNGAKLPGLCSPVTCVDGSWKVTGSIEECCKHCYLFDTSHVVTFDNNFYNWNGPCNYSVAQTGSTYYPEVAVYTSFTPCFAATFCLGQTTFKNDPYTVITLTHVLGTELFYILVNGHTYVVPDNVVTQVKSATNTHPVLAWREGKCLFLLGSSGLTVQHCPHRLDVWAFPTHSTNLHGLCGHFNFHPTDDMTARDGTVHPVVLNPLAFPESWRTNDQSSHLCQQPCRYCNNPTTSSPCVASAAQKKLYSVLCRRHLYPVLGPDTELQHHVDACELDMCMLEQAGVSKLERRRWLVEIIKLTQNSKILLAKASGIIVPDPLSLPSGIFCVAGSSWQQDCNRCGCSGQTSFPVCTLVACQEDFVPEFGGQFCSNGSRWRRDECNGCACINRGIVCSFDECSSTAPTVTTPSTTTPTFTPTFTSPPIFICSLPRKPGTCTSQIIRWYYDFGNGRCLPFYFTGCGGNLNNFETEGQCLAACGHLTTPKTVTPATSKPFVCYLRWAAGTCQQAQLKYYYSTEAGTCIQAYYSGCGGNDNRFDSFEECMHRCG